MLCQGLFAAGLLAALAIASPFPQATTGNTTSNATAGQITIEGLPYGALLVNSTTTKNDVFNTTVNSTFDMTQGCGDDPLIGTSVTNTIGNSTTTTTLIPPTKRDTILGAVKEVLKVALRGDGQ
jgi:hypothetical protein